MEVSWPILCKAIQDSLNVLSCNSDLSIVNSFSFEISDLLKSSMELCLQADKISLALWLNSSESKQATKMHKLPTSPVEPGFLIPHSKSSKLVLW